MTHFLVYVMYRSRKAVAIETIWKKTTSDFVVVFSLNDTMSFHFNPKAWQGNRRLINWSCLLEPSIGRMFLTPGVDKSFLLVNSFSLEKNLVPLISGSDEAVDHEIWPCFIQMMSNGLRLGHLQHHNLLGPVINWGAFHVPFLYIMYLSCEWSSFHWSCEVGTMRS